MAKLAINPNTVLKAYRDPRTRGAGCGLDRARGRSSGTLPRTDPAAHPRFLVSMGDWLRKARAAGLGPDDIEAIYRTAFRNLFAEGVA